jgi:FMN reductase
MSEQSAPTRTKTIVAVGGSTRSGSSSEVLMLAVAEAVAEQTGARLRTFAAEFISALPFAGTNWGSETPEQTEFIQAAGTADAIVLGTPAYHGGVSGLVKNALDHLGDFEGSGGGRIAPVGVVVSGTDPLSVFNTVRAARDISARMRGVPTPSAVAVLSKPGYQDENGRLLAEVQQQVDTVAREIVALLD